MWSIIAEINTEVGESNYLNSVSCQSDDELWTCSNIEIRLTDLQGKLLNSFQSKSLEMLNDITVTKSGKLVFTDRSRKYGICDDCPPGNLCKNGFNISCPAGYFCPNGTSVFICPEGYYCPAGRTSPMPCPIGTFNPYSGNGTEKACLKCTPGLYCKDKGLSVPSGPCSPGFYCNGGSILPWS